jgi:ABC-type uncharacterized transport system ATPase subunit
MGAMAAIMANQLEMTYQAPVRTAGLRAALGSLVRREAREVHAVRRISFTVEPGEIVGFLGPNGAGKTTTLKMLSGILHPTGGEASVVGYQPWRRDPRLLRQIAMIRGSRPLSGPGELTVLDALRFQQLIYEVSDVDFGRSLQALCDLLGLAPLLSRQVRALSLGERMRAGLALSLVYQPQVLFLDEPTVGLDITTTSELRRFIADYGRAMGATIVLTSHNMVDVEALCPRVILIDRGTIVYDGELAELGRRLAPDKLLTLSLSEDHPIDLTGYGKVVNDEGRQVSLQVPRASVPAVTARLLAELPIADLTVTEPPLETVMERVYREGLVA